MQDSTQPPTCPEALRTIDIDEFVDLSEIDPLFFDSGYYLAPEGVSPKAYALLSKALFLDAQEDP